MYVQLSLRYNFVESSALDVEPMDNVGVVLQKFKFT